MISVSAQLDQLPNQLLEVANQAGHALMEWFGKDAGVNIKKDGSPVSKADMQSHQRLCQGLKKILDIPILSEESEHSHQQTDLRSTFFVIDPLDGTKSFLQGSADFVITIALVKGGQPLIGVIHVPALSVTYFAIKDKGAFKRDGNRLQKIAASSRRSNLIGVASRNHSSDSDRQLFEALGCTEVRYLGSALKFCLVADGSADLYVRTGRTMIWDSLAAELIIKEAGGGMTYFDKSHILNGSLRMRNEGFICANRVLDERSIAKALTESYTPKS